MIFKSLSFFLLIFLISTQSDDKLCSTFLHSLSEKLANNSTLSQIEELTIKYCASGSKIKKTGSYAECTSNPELYYFTHLLRVAKEQEIIDRGICLPRFCSSGEFIHSEVNPLIFSIFKWDHHTNWEVELYDPQKIKSDSSWMYLFAVLVVMILAALNMLACVLRYKKNVTNKYLAFFKRVFDPIEALQELFQSSSKKKTDKSLLVFEFLRGVSCYWILCHHAIFFYVYLIVDFEEYHKNFMSTYEWLYLYLGYYPVEFFFVIQGFFAAFSIVPKMEKAPGLKTYLYVIIHRFFRTWPAYMVSLLLYWKIAPSFANGPLWYLYYNKIKPCENYAFKNALYIDNLYNDYFDKYCLDMGWFLAVDFQKYWLFPLVAYAYVKKRWAGYLLCLLFFVQSFGMAIDSCFEHEILFSTEGKSIQTYWYFYWKPWLRWYASYPGMALAFVYLEYKRGKEKGFNIFRYFEKRAKLSHITSFAGFMLIVAIITIPHVLQVYGQNYWSHTFRILWVGLGSLIACNGFSMIFTPLLTKNDLALKRFMTLRVFKIMGTLSYSFYLVHYMTIQIVVFTATSYESKGDFVHLRILELKSIILTQFCSVFVYVLIERPMIVANFFAVGYSAPKKESEFQKFDDEKSQE